MAFRKIEAELECPICFERFDMPKVLPCQHTFCYNCLQHLEKNVGGTRNVKCPECRRDHRVPANGFPTNITISRLLLAIQLQTIRNPAYRTTIQPTAPPMELSPAHQPIHVIQTRPEYPLPQGAYIPSRGTTSQEPFVSSSSQQNLLQATELERSHATEGERSEAQPPPDHIYQSSRSAVRQNGEERSIFNCCRCRGFVQFFGKTRQRIRLVISSFLRRFNKCMIATIIFFLLITVARFIAGAVKLSSDCPKEKHVAEFLFAKSCLACLFWATLVALRFNKKLMDAMYNNLFIEVYVIVVEGFFSLIWLIVGTIWTIGMREQMLDECPILVNHWNHAFITCAMAMVIFDWVALGIFLFYSLYIMFDNTEE